MFDNRDLYDYKTFDPLGSLDENSKVNMTRDLDDLMPGYLSGWAMTYFDPAPTVDSPQHAVTLESYLFYFSRMRCMPL